MDESVIPQTSQYYFYSRGIIASVIVHGHVINIYIYVEWHWPAWVKMWETLWACNLHGKALYKYPPLLLVLLAFRNWT